MSVFPGGFTPFVNALRSMKLLADDGTSNGTITLAQLLALISADDMKNPLMSLGDVVETVPADATSYTVTAADRNKTKRFLCTSACAVNLPAGLPVGFIMDWVQSGAGVLTFQSAAGAGQSIGSAAGAKSAGQFGRGTLEVLATDAWNLSGYTTA